MFHTINYRHAWIQVSHYPGCREHIIAHAAPYRVLGEFPSLHAAKLAITRDYKELQRARAKDAAEHHARIQSIVRGE